MASPIGFERWKEKYPNGTEEDYLKALDDFKATHVVIKAPPKMVPIPGGGFIAIGAMSPSECASLNQEFVKGLATNQ